MSNSQKLEDAYSYALEYYDKIYDDKIRQKYHSIEGQGNRHKIFLDRPGTVPDDELRTVTVETEDFYINGGLDRNDWQRDVETLVDTFVEVAFSAVDKLVVAGVPEDQIWVCCNELDVRCAYMVDGGFDVGVAIQHSIGVTQIDR